MKKWRIACLIIPLSDDKLLVAIGAGWFSQEPATAVSERPAIRLINDRSCRMPEYLGRWTVMDYHGDYCWHYYADEQRVAYYSYIDKVQDLYVSR